MVSGLKTGKKTGKSQKRESDTKKKA